MFGDNSATIEGSTFSMLTLGLLAGQLEGGGGEEGISSSVSASMTIGCSAANHCCVAFSPAIAAYTSFAIWLEFKSRDAVSLPSTDSTICGEGSKGEPVEGVGGLEDSGSPLDM